jgi:lysophospholipase L1-like esterase
MRQLFFLILPLTLAGCVTVSQPASLQAGDRYVAMGSSFAAGPGILPAQPGTPARCTRSTRNYASLLAARLGLALDDQSCGGATTAHITGPWSELPAQVDAVNADTRLVTVTIGGNDVGYVMNLFAASCGGGTFTVQGRTISCPALRPPGAEAYARLEASLREIAAAVRTRAPRARLVFVQYLKLVPDANCAATGLTPEGLIATRAIGEQLGRITAKVAAEEGAEALAINTHSRGHTACDTEPWSVGAKPGDATDSGTPWHPNAAGMRAIAAELERLVRG